MQPPPDSGSTAISSLPLASTRASRAQARTTRSPQRCQPALSGVTSERVVTGSGAACGQVELHAIASVSSARTSASVGHRVGAQEARGDDGAGAVREAHALGGRPAREQAVAERAAERVACAETADHGHAQARHDLALVCRGDEHALAALLDDREPQPARSARRPRARDRAARPHPALLAIADGRAGERSAPPMTSLASASFRQNVGR